MTYGSESECATHYTTAPDNSTLSTNQTSEEDSSAQFTSSGLFAGCKRRRVEPTSVSAQLASYIALCDEFDESDVQIFGQSTDHACVSCSLWQCGYCQLLHPVLHGTCLAMES